MKNLEYYLSLNYHKTVIQDDEGDYIVEVQELPGCVADGKTPNEAFENLREAMKSWLASRMEARLEVPEPRAEEDYSGRILVRMAKFLHRRLVAQSALEGVSLNHYIVTLLTDASARVTTPPARVGVPLTGAYNVLHNLGSEVARFPRVFAAIQRAKPFERNVLPTNWEGNDQPSQGISGTSEPWCYVGNWERYDLTISSAAHGRPLQRPQIVRKNEA